MDHTKGVFGIKGWLKIAVDVEYPDSLLDYSERLLSKNGKTLGVVLETGKPVGDELQVKFEGIDDHDRTFALCGYTVGIPCAEFSPTRKDEYYWMDLIGITVTSREDTTPGTVKNLMETGANDVLVIQDINKQILIPSVSNYIETVNHDSKTIMADWDLNY